MNPQNNTFVGGGGLGDAVLILNKFRQLSAAGDRLVFVTEQATAARMAGDFFKSQGIEADVRLVASNDQTVRALKRDGMRVLNTSWPGFPPLMPWLLATYPFDAVLKPTMEFQFTPFSHPKPYFIVQTNAGTMKYGSGKNWRAAGWINQFVRFGQELGLDCVLVGTENPGITGANAECFNLPLPQVLGVIHGAKFLLGLQGFVSIVALMMGKPVLLKRENFLVVIQQMHLAWHRRMTVFAEPDRPSEQWVRGMLDKAMIRER